MNSLLNRCCANAFYVRSAIFVLVASAVLSSPSSGQSRPGVDNARHYSTTGPHVAKLASSLLDEAEPLFLPAVTYGTAGYNPYSVAVADVNGDGKPDLIVANQNEALNTQEGSVSVLLGKGDGTFQSPVAYDSGGGIAYSVAVADLNHDGKLDLIVGNGCDKNNCGTGGVSVLLGNGDGTFRAPVTYNTGEGSYFRASVAVADLNGDGKLDVAVLTVADSCGPCAEGSVVVLLGKGDGTLEAAVAYATGGFAGLGSVAIADVNGDDRLDLVVSNYCATECSYPPTLGSVGVLLGKGDGTFQPAVSYSSGGYGTSSVAVADLNKDGKLDLIATSCGPEACGPGRAGGVVSVLMGNGDGSFQTAVPYDAATGPFSVVVADVNGDGISDVIASNWGTTDNGSNDGAVSVLLGNGDGTLQPVVTFPSGGAETPSVAIADVNGDGRPDIVLACVADIEVQNSTGVVSVLLNNSGSTTTALVSSQNPSLIGQTVTFTATVTSASGAPTGTVVFYDGTSSLGSALLANGSTSLSTSMLALGPHSITAAYQGSNTFPPSTSLILNQVVNSTSNTMTTLASSKNPGVYQQPVTFTAVVTSESGTPTGTVVFKDGNAALASAMLTNGAASFTTSGLKRGAHSMTAVYIGSGGFGSSTSPVLDEEINKSGLFETHIQITSGGGSSFVGQTISFTATVTSNGGAIPDGDVVSFSNGYSSATGTTHGGVASASLAFPIARSYLVSASYLGDENFGRSFTKVTQRVSKYPTTTVLVSSQNPLIYGQPVTFMATVTSAGPNPPTGKVRFGFGSATLVGGVATITETLFRAGTHAVTASYEGDTASAASASAVLDEVVNQASTTTTLVSSLNPSSSGQSVTFTATVTSSTGVDPFGKVTFTAGSTTLGSVAVSGTKASISTSTLPTGTTTITATYGGAAGFVASSDALQQKVNP